MIKFVFTGDIMLAREIGKKLLDSNNIQIISERVSLILDEADFCIGNLECPVSEIALPINSQGFRALPHSLNQIKKFDLLTLSNNHIFDCGKLGALDTINHIKLNNILFSGLLIDENSYIQPIIKNVKGKNFAFFSCSVEDCIKNQEDYFPKIIEATDNCLLDSIKKTCKNVDYSIVTVHGGNEMIPYPQPSFRKLCQTYIENGADIVITTHPHVLGGYEKYNSGHIFYSLGDFIFDAESYLRRKCAILRITICDQLRWELIPTTITKNFEIILAEVNLRDSIAGKFDEISKSLSSAKYEEIYPKLYKRSLAIYQIDRLKFKIQNKGFLHLFGFILSKLYLIPFYFKSIIKGSYK